MGASWIVGGNLADQSVYNDNGTGYRGLIGGDGDGNDPTEANADTPIRLAGVIDKLYTYAPSNAITADSVITLRKSGAATALTVTYGADQTGIKEDTSNTVTVAATDEVCFEIARGPDAGTNLLNLPLTAVRFTPTDTSKTMTLYAVQRSLGTAFSSTRYFAPNSDTSSSATEGSVQYTSRFAQTLSNLWTMVEANSRDADVVFPLRKNGAAGNQSVTYTAGQTGVKEDTSNTDAIAVDDEFNFAIEPAAGTGTITLNTIAVMGVSTQGKFGLVSGRSGGLTIANNTTYFFPPGGTFGSSLAVEESYWTIYPRFTFTASELGAYVSANSFGSLATTVTVRENGADSAITLSYSAGQTGWKGDTSNSIEVLEDTDDICYKVTTPNETGSLTLHQLPMVGAVAVV